MRGFMVKQKLHYAGAGMMVNSTSAIMILWQSIFKSRRGGTWCALVAYFKYCHQNCNRELLDARQRSLAADKLVVLPGREAFSRKAQVLPK